MNNLLPYYYFSKTLKNVLNEIKINPEYVDYYKTIKYSKYFNNQVDYEIFFIHNEVTYVLALLYYPINNDITYNIVFTTSKQWDDYNLEYLKIKKRGHITDDDNKKITEIIDKSTNFGELYPLMRKISWVLFDIHDKYMKSAKYSLIDSKNVKIKLYRNIIKDSFDNIEESIVEESGIRYYLYEVINKQSPL